MTTLASAAARPGSATPISYTEHAVTSHDGTAIGYRQLGSGPGLVMLHGSMETAASHQQLAEALADAFTVYLPDRRGRGRSGPYAPYPTEKTVEDLGVLLDQTGARDVFGVSSGGLVALRGALAGLPIRRLAVYEPPLFPDDPARPAAQLARLDQELASGRLTDALVTGMLSAEMGPPIFGRLPRWFLAGLTDLGTAIEARRAKPGDVTMRDLAPTLHGDFQLVVEASADWQRFGEVTPDLLLLGGSASPAYLKAALDTLQGLLPRARRVEFPGLNHGGSGNTDRQGKPAIVAAELRRFFA